MAIRLLSDTHHVSFTCCRAEFGGAVDAASVLEFIDAGRDVVIAVDSRVSDELRSGSQPLHDSSVQNKINQASWGRTCP